MENIVSTQEKRCYTVKELQEILGISIDIQKQDRMVIDV